MECDAKWCGVEVISCKTVSAYWVKFAPPLPSPPPHPPSKIPGSAADKPSLITEKTIHGGLVSLFSIPNKDSRINFVVPWWQSTMQDLWKGTKYSIRFAPLTTEAHFILLQSDMYLWNPFCIGNSYVTAVLTNPLQTVEQFTQILPDFKCMYVANCVFSSDDRKYWSAELL